MSPASWSSAPVARPPGSTAGIWYDYNALAEAASDQHEPAVMKCRGPALHPLHLRFDRSAQGCRALVGGYLVYAAMTHEYVFDYHEGDVFWCTADVGWVTGHSYIVYGPFANGATTLMFEGVPTYPDAGRFWEVCEKHKVNQFYTAPTAIRALMGQGGRVRDEIRSVDPAASGDRRRADQPRGLELVQ
jgi:acetyl-CoA synthetase